jgi:branched-chain amino acid transport system permease protein
MVRSRSRPLADASLLLPAVAIIAVQMIWYPMPSGAVLSGAVLGVLGALAAIGMALVWRANRIVNFAQGDLGALPATLAVLLVTLGGLPWLLGVTIGLVAAIVVGLLVDVIVVRRFFRSPRLQLTVVTLGIAQVLAFGALLLPRWWDAGPAIRTMPPPFDASFTLGGVAFDANDIIAMVVAPLLMVAVAVVLRLTDTGVAIRAAADRTDRASMLGIPVRRLEAQVWVLATVLAYVAVVLTAGVASLPFGLGLGLSVVLRALTAMVIGRMTHLVVIAITSVTLGVLEAGIRWNTGDATLVSPFLAALIVIALLLQRRGATRAARDDSSAWGATGEVRPVPRVLARLPEVRLTRVALVLLAGLVVLGLPPLLGTNGQLKAGVIVVFATIGTSVVVLTGWAGQVSLGQMAFVGVGAAIGAWATVEQGWDPLTSMLLAGPVGALVAVLVGLPALRLRGLYLAVTTLALSLAASEWIFSNRAVDWIPEGSFPRPALLHRISLDSPLRLYYFSLVVLVLAACALRGVRRSRTGRVLIALRDNEPGTAAYGVHTTRAKLGAFAMSGFIAAVSGVVLVIHQAAFRPVTYGAEESLTVFTATVVGGLGSVVGAVLGAIFQRGSQWLLPTPWSVLATGLGVLVVLSSVPDGLGGLLYRARDRLLGVVARRHGIADTAFDRSHEAHPPKAAPPVVADESLSTHAGTPSTNGSSSDGAAAPAEAAAPPDADHAETDLVP